MKLVSISDSSFPSGRIFGSSWSSRGRERKAAYSRTVERAAKEKSERGRNNQPDKWIEIGNESHSWSSDSYLTTSSDVHMVSWATWSYGCILGLPTFEANVVCLPPDVDRESAQDFAFQDAYIHSLSQRVTQQKLEPGTLELTLYCQSYSEWTVLISSRALLVKAHLSNTKETCKLEAAAGSDPRNPENLAAIKGDQAPTILVRTRSPQEKIRICSLSVLEWNLH